MLEIKKSPGVRSVKIWRVPLKFQSQWFANISNIYIMILPVSISLFTCVIGPLHAPPGRIMLHLKGGTTVTSECIPKHRRLETRHVSAFCFTVCMRNSCEHIIIELKEYYDIIGESRPLSGFC